MSFEPHLHAPGQRMCLEAIWGFNIQTLSCVGYDHNWVRGYTYEDDYAPLLPKGTILHIIGFMDNSPSNKNLPDPRNWQGRATARSRTCSSTSASACRCPMHSSRKRWRAAARS